MKEKTLQNFLVCLLIKTYPENSTYEMSAQKYQKASTSFTNLEE